MDEIASSHHRRSDSGFTLVELLIVVFIIGLMSSVVVMSLPKGKIDSRTEADNLIVAIASLSREAIASGEAVSWTHIEGQNLFEKYHAGEWIALNASSRAVAKSQKTEELKVTVQLEGLETQRKFVDDKRVKAEAPLVFFPTGEATPALIRLSAKEFDAVYNLSPSGKIVFVPKNERAN